MAFTEGFWAADSEGNVANMNACLLAWGPKADFPAAAAGNKGRVAWATDEKFLYYSDGSAWVLLPFTFTDGTYTGDDSTNRAITHSLTVVPRIILIKPRSNGYNVLQGLRGQAHLFGGATLYSVTAPTTTNFYVGDGASAQSGNSNAIVYDWVALP